MSNTGLVILLIIAYAVLACFKLYAQAKYSKGNIKCFSDTVVFWLLIFFFIGVSFIPSAVINGEFKVEIILYSFLAGVGIVGFQLFYTLALKEGPVGLTAFMTSACSVVYIIYCLIVFKEQFTICKGFGIAFFVGALAFNIKKDPKKNINLKWGILTFITCAFLILQTIVTKYFANDFSGEYKTGFLAMEYIAAVGILIVILIPLFINKKARPKVKIDKWFFIFGIVIAAILVGTNYINQWTISIADMSYITPIRGAIIMILSIGEGWLVYKEKPTLLQWGGIICGILATILMNF